MVKRAYAAWTDGKITSVLPSDIKAAFPSVTKGRLVNGMKAKDRDGNLAQWTESFLSERTVEMIIMGHAITRHPVEAEVQQCSPISPILLAIYTSGLINWVEEYISAKGLSVVHDLGWVATGSNVNQVVTKLEQCAAKSIEWASRWGLQFDTVETEAALFSRRRGHRKHLLPKLSAKITVGDGFIRSNEDGTCWLGIWRVVRLKFKEHHNRCMRKTRAAEARLRTLTETYGVVPGSVQAVQIACIQAVAQYRRELWWHPKDVGR